MPARQRFQLALIVFTISFTLRAVWSAWVNVTPVSDFRGYDLLAVHWLDTGVFGAPGRYAYRTPGYPAFLSLIYTVFGHNWEAATIVQAFIGGFTSGFTTVLATYFLSSRSSVIAGLLHAFSPTAIAYVPVLASENLAVLLLVTGLLLVSIARRTSGWKAIEASLASGFLLGLLLLVRPAAIFFSPGWIAATAYPFAPRRSVVLSPLLVVLGASLVLSPWVVRNHKLGLGAFTLSSSGGVNLWMGNNDLARTGGYIGEARDVIPTNNLVESQKDAAYRNAAITWILQHPTRYLALSGRRLVRIMGVYPDGWAAKSLPSVTSAEASTSENTGVAVQGPTWTKHTGKINRRLFLAAIRAILAPLVILSLVLSFSQWHRYLDIVLPALSYIVGLSLTYVQIRFREILNPLLFIPLAGLTADMLFGSDELGNWLSRRGKILLSAVLVALTVGVHISGLAGNAYRLHR